MGENSKIEWTHHTFNPWRGCTKVSAGCANCYADAQAKRNPAVLGVWGPQGARVVASEAMWRQPAKWNADAKAASERRRVFCASMADVFEDVPESAREAVEAARKRLWETILRTPNLDWLLLTKRPERIMELVPDGWRATFPPNVWIGTSVENQATADERIPHLLRVPARVRFLSMEPLLGPVDLDTIAGSRFGVPGCYSPLLGEWWPALGDADLEYQRRETDLPRIDWVIVGGESGPKARPMHPEWARSLRDQCRRAGVPFFFKQWGEWQEGSAFTEDDRIVLVTGHVLLGTNDATPDEERRWRDLSASMMSRVGKHAAGRLLNGCTWDEVPRG